MKPSFIDASMTAPKIVITCPYQIAGELCSFPLKIGRSIYLTPGQIEEYCAGRMGQTRTWTCPACGYISTIPDVSKLNAPLPVKQYVVRAIKLHKKQREQINEVVRKYMKSRKCGCKKKCTTCKCEGKRCSSK